MSPAEHIQLAPDERRAPDGDVEPPFQSILFPAGAPGLGAAEQPSFFRDLNLDQVVDAVVAGRDEYDLGRFFYLPLRSVDEVAYRHEVFRDLENDAIRAALQAFADRMHRVRAFVTLVSKQHYKYEKQRWFLDAAALYREAVTELTRGLADASPNSRGLGAFVSYLKHYSSADTFTALASAVDAAHEALDHVVYTFRINGSRVTVARYEGEDDYTPEIEELFERFRQGSVESHLMKVGDPGSMDHVEAQIAELVARLYPREFEVLDHFCSRYQSFLDPTIAAFDREVQFYLAFIEHLERITGSDLAFCYPEASDSSRGEAVEGAFDLALAAKLRAERGSVVCNDFSLDDDERIIVVTGPNQGGKTTFARMFGQLHYLTALGVSVPARRARLFLADRLFTHFEREEEVGTLRGRLDDELVRIRGILEEATGDSVVVLNEIFASATLADALDLGTEVLTQLIERGCLGVCVTFIDELSRLGEATESMVAQVSPSDPAKRTFRVVEQPADGRAYAWAIARKYGLSHEQLRERFER